jgi:hypothetical protein
MPEFSALFCHSLLYGSMLSVLLSLIILISLRINPAMWTDDAPADLKAKVGPLSAQTKRQRRWVSIPFFGILAVVLIGSILPLRTMTGGELSFLLVFTHIWIVLMTFNLVDLLIIDWLVVGLLQPKFVIVPGTEGMAGYRDYAFHARAFVKGSIAMFALSLIVAGLTVWLS